MSIRIKYSFRIFTVLVLTFLLTQESHADRLSDLHTRKKILPVSEISAPYYAIQILALKETPQNAEFFRNVDRAREFECRDGFVRYTVGRYSSKQEASRDLSEYKGKGYSQSFVVDIRDYNLAEGNQVIRNDQKIEPDKTYTVQIAALRYPVYLDHFEEFDQVLEFYPDDRVYRYTVGEFKGENAAEELKKVQAKGYPNAHLVPLEEYKPYRIE